MSRTSTECRSFVPRMISRLIRVWRTSMSGVAPTLRAARISSTENSSGTSIMSNKTRSPFFRSVEYSMSSFASFLQRGSVMRELLVVSGRLSVAKRFGPVSVVGCSRGLGCLKKCQRDFVNHATLWLEVAIAWEPFFVSALTKSVTASVRRLRYDWGARAVAY